jgi:hypothetical protein
MTIKAHFDGKVFVPDEPVDIQAGEPVTVVLKEHPDAERAPAGKTAGDLLAVIEANPQIKEDWDAIAAGRDSVEVAQELRLQASKPRYLINDPP